MSNPCVKSEVRYLGDSFIEIGEVMNNCPIRASLEADLEHTLKRLGEVLKLYREAKADLVQAKGNRYAPVVNDTIGKFVREGNERYLQKTIQDLRTIVESHRAAIVKLENEKASLTKELADVRARGTAEIVMLKQTIDRLTQGTGWGKAAEYEQKVGQLMYQIMELKEQLKISREANKNLNKENEGIVDNLDAHREKIDFIEKELKAVREENTKLEKENDVLQSTIRRLRGLLDAIHEKSEGY